MVARSSALLLILLAAFVMLQCWMPLRTTIRIGADEGYEMAKAILCQNDYQLYTEIWNDQPPLDTFLVTLVVKHISSSPLAARLLTVAFAVVLLKSVFLMSLRVNGLLTAGIVTAFLIASPGFLELSCSVMQEIPALAPAIVGISVLLLAGPDRMYLAEVGAGLLFAVGLQMKFIEAVHLPIAALILWLRYRSNLKALALASLVFITAIAAGFFAINYLIGGGAFLTQLGQSWSAHFAAARSYEYGSPADHPFEWTVLLKNWDATIPALLGVILSVQAYRKTPLAIIPVVWLALTLAVFDVHKPWWSYYYIHIAVPLCWCAGIGMAGLIQWIRERRNLALTVPLGVVALIVVSWMVARLYLQADSIRHSPQTYSSLVLGEVARLKPFTKFLYTDEPVYSFHTGIPLPPKLGVISLKRFWSGDMSNARLTEELQTVKPGLILIGNTTHELPYQTLLKTEYRLIYEDQAQRLYALRTLLTQAKQSRTAQ